MPAPAETVIHVAPGIRIHLTVKVEHDGTAIGVRSAGSGSSGGASPDGATAGSNPYVEPMRAAMGNMAQIQRDGLAAQFRAEGPGWKPLALRTLVQKRRKGQPDSILIGIRKLFLSYTDKDSPDHIEEIVVQSDGGSGSVESGSSVSYAEAHQNGAAARTVATQHADAHNAGGGSALKRVTDAATAEKAGPERVRKTPAAPAQRSGLAARPLVLRPTDIDAMEEVVDDLVATIETATVA